MGINNYFMKDDFSKIDEEKTDNRRISKLKSFKFAVIAICLGLFACNSFVVFQQYIGRQTIISNDIEVHSKMLLPSITICGTRGFKEEFLDYSYAEKEKYIENTFDLNEMIAFMEDKNEKMYNISDLLGGVKGIGNLWNVKMTYSAYRGRCFTIEYKKEVAARENVAIGLNGTNQFKLYLHEKGEEYFLHYDYWPYVPFTHQSKQEDIWVDVNLEKEVFEELYETNESIFVRNQVFETACEKFDYFACLRCVFQNEIEKEDLNCTLPWIESMLANTDYNATYSKPPCSDNFSYDRTQSFGQAFGKEISKYGSKYDSICQVQKRIPKYDVEIQTYDKWSGPRPMNPNSTLRRISIYYYKTTVQVSTTSKLFSFSSFISSIGGNLGLFVGFSFISAILFICNMIEDATNNISFVLWY